MTTILIPVDTILKTKRLKLRYPKPDDATEILSVVQSPQFPDQLPLKELKTVSEIENWLKRLQDHWAKGRVFSWIVDDLDTGKILGQVTLSKTEGDNRWAMAFWTHPNHWGKGYATEGAERVLAFGFEEVGAKNIWAGAGEWNKRSYRVLEKLGMRYTGNNSQGYYSKGMSITTLEYEISKKGWRKGRESQHAK